MRVQCPKSYSRDSHVQILLPAIRRMSCLIWTHPPSTARCVFCASTTVYSAYGLMGPRLAYAPGAVLGHVRLLAA